MAEAKFDKDGNIENLAELSAEEVAAAYKVKNNEVFTRATLAEKKADEERIAREKLAKDLEEAKKTPPVEVSNKPTTPDISEELRLIAKGLSEEEINEAKAIAKGKDISLQDALKTKTFLAFQRELAEERKKEEAKLGASHGSGQGKGEIKFKPGMTREEHEAAVKEAMGGN